MSHPFRPDHGFHLLRLLIGVPLVVLRVVLLVPLTLLTMLLALLLPKCAFVRVIPFVIRLMLMVCGFWWISVRTPKTKPTTPVGFIAMNHQTAFDFAIVWWVVFTRHDMTPRTMAKASIFHGCMGVLLRKCESIPVDRRNGTSTARETLGALKATTSPVMIAPEGTCCDGVGPFKTGVAEPMLPVLPVGLLLPTHLTMGVTPESGQLLSVLRQLMSFGTRATVCLCEVVEPAANDSKREFTDRIRQEILNVTGLEAHDLSLEDAIA